MNSIQIAILILGIACLVTSHLTWRKGFPFTILALFILNCALFCFYYSTVRHFDPQIVYFYSSLMFPIALLSFFRNLHRRRLQALDKFLLAMASIEYVLAFVLTVIYHAKPDLLPAKQVWHQITERLSDIGLMQPEAIDPNRNLIETISINLSMLFFYINAFIFPVTLYIIFQTIYRAKKRHLNYFTADTFNFYQWNYRFMLVISACTLFIISVIIYNEFFAVSRLITNLLFFVVGVGGLFCGILAYYNPSFYGKEKNFSLFLEYLSIPNTPSQKVTTTDKSNPYSDLKEKLEGLMQQEHFYRDPMLSLGDLAKKLHISNRHLSRVVNEGYGKSFSEYVNHYRVEEVKQHLVDPNFAHYSILSIGLEAGFNAKSSFYTVFKRHTGMNPAAYRKRELDKSVQ